MIFMDIYGGLLNEPSASLRGIRGAVGGGGRPTLVAGSVISYLS